MRLGPNPMADALIRRVKFGCRRRERVSCDHKGTTVESTNQRTPRVAGN